MSKKRVRCKLRRFWRRFPGVLLELLNPFELLGEAAADPGPALAVLGLICVVAVVLLTTAAFFGIMSDVFDRTPLQTLGLK